MDGPTGPDHRQRVIRLYREYGPVVYRRCVRLLGDRESARDATQEVFVKLLRQEALQGDGEQALRWIYKVATHHCLNLRRDRMRRREVGNGAAEEVLEVAGEAPTSFPARRLAQQVLGRFDATTQAVVVGVLVDGMEHEEVAGVLGISRRTVHRKLSRFLERARRLLAVEEP
jgi:RNA polymerase sigma-70 factor (ECF subfamily)